MTREIKFRAWDKSEELMHDVIVFQRGEFIAVPEIGADGWKLSKRKLSDVEIMQFTGLKDKNGKEIYEGDIFFTKALKSEWYSVVEWDADKARFIRVMKGKYGNLPFGLEEAPQILEVIGNIYENPELLK